MRGTVIASAAAPDGDELSETMHELRPNLEPSDELRRRMEGMAIKADAKNRRRLVRQKRFRIIGQTGVLQVADRGICKLRTVVGNKNLHSRIIG